MAAPQAQGGVAEIWYRHAGTGPGGRGLRYKVRQEVMEQLFEANQPNLSLPSPVDGLLTLYPPRYSLVVPVLDLRSNLDN